MPKYPNIEVQLTGTDGNAFAIIGKVKKELQKNKVSKEETDTFISEAMSGNYNNVLITCMNWVNVS